MLLTCFCQAKTKNNFQTFSLNAKTPTISGGRRCIGSMKKRSARCTRESYYGVVGFSLCAEVEIDDIFCSHHNLAGLSRNGTVRGYANIQARPVSGHDVLGFTQCLDVSRGRIEHSEHSLFDAVIDYLSIHSLSPSALHGP